MRNSRINTHRGMPAKCRGGRQYHSEACSSELRNERLTTVRVVTTRVGLTESFSEATLCPDHFCILLGARAKPRMLIKDP